MVTNINLGMIYQIIIIIMNVLYENNIGEIGIWDFKMLQSLTFWKLIMFGSRKIWGKMQRKENKEKK